MTQSETRLVRAVSFTKEQPYSSSTDGFNPVQGVVKRSSSSLRRSGLSRFYDKKARSFASLNEVSELARLYGDGSSARILSKLSNSNEPGPLRHSLSAPSSPSRTQKTRVSQQLSKSGCEACNNPSASMIYRCRCSPSTTRRSAEHVHGCSDYGIQSMCLAFERSTRVNDGESAVQKKKKASPELLWTCWEIAA